MASEVRSSRASRPAPLLSARTQESVLGLTLLGLLLGFAVVVVREVVATLGGGDHGQTDEYQLFAVSLTGLAGGVFAVAMRHDTRRAEVASAATGEARVRRATGTAFVLVYMASGVVAVTVCLVRLGDSTSLLRSLAATFLGTSVAAASAVFGTQPVPAPDPPAGH